MKSIPPAQTFKPPQPAAASIDKALHSQLSRASMGLSPISLSLAFADWAMHLAVSPGRQALLGSLGMSLSWQAWVNTLQVETEVDVHDTPVPEKDHRFKDDAWKKWPFKALKESFQASDSWWQESARVDGVGRHHQHVVNFFSRQWLDALSPSNWPLTNPEVLKKTRESMGQNLLQGHKNYLLDLKEHHKARAIDGPGPLKPLDYEVGKDVAVTPGKVVFRNHLVELIQYTPSTKKVVPEPLLIVPSCIMKYYILDLSPANSMVRFLVGRGYTVFMMSWRNPDASDRDLGMQDYLQMGVMECMAAVKSLTGAPRIHAMGYCLGGTFLSIVAAALGRPENANRWAYLPELATATLLASLTDFSEPGELGVFIDDDQIQTLRETMSRTGYMPGRQMGGAFQFLNSRELIWARQTHRYLLGEDNAGNDMMSWNTDVTRLTECMHSEYLSSLYLDNALASGHYRLGGTGVALMDIKVPMLVVGTVRDHVSPWRSVYKIHLLTDTHTTFILAAGGHNAGIVSEPGHPRRSYQLASVESGHGWTEPDEWVATAPAFEGSWWEAMDAFLKARSGKPVSPPPFHAEQVLGDAPGDYVQVRYSD
jgi:polyhydroxyalkanoate synthase